MEQSWGTLGFPEAYVLLVQYHSPRIVPSLCPRTAVPCQALKRSPCRNLLSPSC